MHPGLRKDELPSQIKTIIEDETVRMNGCVIRPAPGWKKFQPVILTIQTYEEIFGWLINNRRGEKIVR